MAAATYLFLYYLIHLLYGQLGAVLPSNATQLKAAPSSMKTNQFSSNIHLQPSVIHSEVKSSFQTFVGQTISLKPSQTVLNTKGNQREDFSSTGAVPMPSLQSYSGVHKQLTSDMVTGHLSTATATQEITSTTISQYLIVITSSSSNILQNNNHSTSILVSPMLETPTSSSSSISEVMPGLTSSPNGLPIPTVSKANIMSTSSNVKLRSSYVLPSPASSKMKPNQTNSTSVVSNLSSSNVKLRSSNVLPSPTSSKMKPNQTYSTSLVSNLPSSNVKLRSSFVLPSPASSKIKLNQTNSTSLVSSLSSSNVKLNLNSSTMVPPPSSVQKNSNISSTHSVNVISVPVITVEPTSVSQVMRTATSAPLNSSHFVKSIMSSPPWSEQSVTSTVFQTSLFTVTTEASCNNSLICGITLKPSASMQYTSMSNENTLSSSISNNQERNSSSFISSSVSGINTSSILHPEKTTQGPVHGNKEERHTTLIIGLAVGLSLGMVLIILIIVYYRRKRSSYQYNVFYDEQNIVMHPFDYSK